MSIAHENAFLHHIGADLVAWREGYSEFQLPVQGVLLNRQGILQGGVLSTLLDVACGYAGLFSGQSGVRRHSNTVSLNVNFLDRDCGEQVVAKGYLVRGGRSIYFSRAEVWMDGKSLLATAQGAFKFAK